MLFCPLCLGLLEISFLDFTCKFIKVLLPSFTQVTCRINQKVPNLNYIRKMERMHHFSYLYERSRAQVQVLMGWLLLPNALRPFKIYCASPPITSQLVLFLWQTVEIGPLGHVRVVGDLQNFVQNCDPVTLSGICIYIVGVQQFHCR